VPSQTPIDPEKGYWPDWKAKLRNDFRSIEAAQSNDGLVGPVFEQPLVPKDVVYEGSPRTSL
jgi:hypothetical protein